MFVDQVSKPRSHSRVIQYVYLYSMGIQEILRGIRFTIFYSLSLRCRRRFIMPYTNRKNGFATLSSICVRPGAKVPRVGTKCVSL